MAERRKRECAHFALETTLTMRSFQSIVQYCLFSVVTRASAFVAPSALLHGELIAATSPKSNPKYSKVVVNQSSRVGGTSIDVPSTNDSSAEDVLKQFTAPPRTSSPLEKFSEGYSRLTSEHYLLMAFVQAGFLGMYQLKCSRMLHHLTLGMSQLWLSLASLMSGVANAVWLRQLEQAFPGTKTREVATKTLIHAIIIASIINSAYLIGVPVLDEYVYGVNGLSLPPLDISVLRGGWSLEEFITLTKLEILMFIPYNTLAFKFVPPSIRPLTHAAISATFNVAVSAVTLGYFHVWCDRATSLMFSRSLLL